MARHRVTLVTGKSSVEKGPGVMMKTYERKNECGDGVFKQISTSHLSVYAVKHFDFKSLQNL